MEPRRGKEELIRDWIQRLESIDYGAAELSPERKEELYQQLESVADEMLMHGFSTQHVDKAIQFFSTDPELSRSYLYGPSDIGSGKGLVDILKAAL